MAYKAEIAVDVKGLKAVRTLESSLNKISGKISAINKISIGNSKAAKIEEKVAKSKEAQRVSMIQTRRVGDAVQRQTDKGLSTEKAKAAIRRAAKADAQGQLKVAEAQRKIALEELKIQEQIAKVVKDKTLTGFGPKSPVFGRSTQMDSAGNTAAILQDPTTKVSPVQQALEKMEERSARDRKQAVLNRKKSLSLGKDIVRIKTREARLDRKRVQSLAKETKLQRELKSGKFATLKAGMQGPALPPPPASSGLNFDRRTGKLLRGPAGSSPNTLRNLGRRFDTQSALISGGFPLLFGQSPVTAAAGALGGGIGGMFGQMGGFAGGIAATAVVQSIQQAIAGVSKLGQAMSSLAPDIDALTNSMGQAGTAEGIRLKVIEQARGKQAALNAAMENMNRIVGEKGVRGIQEWGVASKKLSESWSRFMLKMGAGFSRLLNWADKFLGLSEGADRGKARDFAATSKDENIKALFKELREAEKANVSSSNWGGGIQSLGKRSVSAIEKDLFGADGKSGLVGAAMEVEEQEKLRDLHKDLFREKLKENELLKAKLEGNYEEVKLAQDIAAEVQRRSDLGIIVNEEMKKTIQSDIKDNNELKKKVEYMEKIKDAWKSIGESLGGSIKDGIKGLIKGTSTLGDLLNNVADKFLDVALNQALFGDILGAGGKKGGGLLGFLGFARGGRPPVGKPSIVGEKGPELFVPRSSGTIVPNNKLGGGGNTNITVNVDASGSDVQGDDAGGQELGSLIAAAIQGEIVKQQRPGGLLNR